MNEITQDMIDELNEELTNQGYCFNFILQDGYTTTAVAFLKNSIGLDSYLLTIKDNIQNYISDWFSQRGIKISWNSELSLFYKFSL